MNPLAVLLRSALLEPLSAHITGMETMSLKHLDRIARALDGCTNLCDEPLGPEYRARIFATVDTPTAATWQSARSIFVAGSITLWQAVISTGLAETAMPTGVQIVEAIEAAVYRTPAL